ncbi:DUF397 domain-containing protein [Polymorphospora sp. NPDC050346]|uniref:DUF397 domain-containing protein n=1 Tax=Polymorphospora sp. NPDC050346 TaxID=3155780 RepID=UPI0033ECA040
MTTHYPTTGWRKSSRSGGDDNCVEINTTVAGIVGVRDSKAGPDGPVLDITVQDFQQFVDDVRAGRYNLP